MNFWNHYRPTLKTARRVVVAVMGATVMLVGAALLVLPGPGLLIIVAGMAILASEFLWARRLLRHVRDRIREEQERYWDQTRREKPDDPDNSDELTKQSARERRADDQ